MVSNLMVGPEKSSGHNYFWGLQEGYCTQQYFVTLAFQNEKKNNINLRIKVIQCTEIVLFAEHKYVIELQSETRVEKHWSLRMQGRSVVECLSMDSEVCGLNLWRGILLWKWALHLNLAPAAHISIILLRPTK